VEARIEVPLEVAALRYTQPEKAREIQRAVSDRFQELLGRGLTVIGLERSETAGTYLLGKWDYE
jgi:predicted GNAT superfamily acetyltransferase